jgi:uncharacterized protein YyaL (SSP411 family)
MRKTLICATLLFATSLLANGINWAKDFNSGMELAKKENKPVFFLTSKHTCPPCQYLAATTFKDEKVIKSLNENFIAIVSYTDEGDYIPRNLFMGMTPTLWFLKPSGEPLFKEVIGAIEPLDFLNGLDVVKARFEESKRIGK